MIRSEIKKQAQRLLHGNYGNWGILAIVPCLMVVGWLLAIPFLHTSTPATNNSVDEYHSWQEQKNYDDDDYSSRDYDDGYDDGYEDGYDDGYSDYGIEGDDLERPKGESLSLTNPVLVNRSSNRLDSTRRISPILMPLFFLIGLLILFFICLLLGFVSITYGGLLQWAAVDTVMKKPFKWQVVFKEFYIDHGKKTIVANLLVAVFTYLWSLLFIVPGIIKQISYRMTNYLMKKDANLTPTQAITLSQQLMKGFKLEYFIFVYSFILWEVAALFSFGFSYLYSVPYFKVAEALFFEQVIEDKKHIFGEEKELDRIDF